MIDITLWRSLTDARGIASTLDWEGLVDMLSAPAPRPADPEKPNLGGWSAASFKDERRAKEKVREVTALVLDLDSGAVPFDRVRLAFFGRRSLVHSTRRYTPDVPRWRVVVAVSRPMTAPEYAVVWTHERDRLAALGIVLDEQAKDASRFWFLPCEPAEGSYVCEALGE